jgi:ribosomal protein S6
MKEEKDNKEYEIAFWLKDESGLVRVKALMADLGIEITYSPEIKRTRFSYPIKKETEGYFGFIHFKGDPENIASLNHELKVDGSVLRFLVSKNPIKKSEIREMRRQIPEVKIIEKVEQKSSDLVTNEELEKKLEEILK